MVNPPPGRANSKAKLEKQGSTRVDDLKAEEPPPAPAEEEFEDIPTKPYKLQFRVGKAAKLSISPVACSKDAIEAVVRQRKEEGSAGRWNICSEIVEEMLTSAFDDQFTTIRLTKLSKKWAAEFSCKHMLEMVQLYLMNHDGEKIEPKEQAKASWMEDEEPVPAAIDCWARGFLNVRVIPKPEPPEQLRPKSGGSVSSAMSKGSKRSSVRTKVERRETTSAEGRKRTALSPGIVSEKAPAKSKKEEDDPEDLLRKNIKARRDVIKSSLNNSEQAKAAQEKIERFQKEAKGKEFTFDSNGEMMVIVPPEPDKLPPPSVVPKLSVLSVQAEGANDQTVNSGKQKNAEKVKVKKKEDPATFFKPLDAQQPSLYSSINLEPGVNLREGTMSKTGGSKQVAENKLTRKQFFDRVSSGQMTSTSAVDLFNQASPSGKKDQNGGGGGGGGEGDTNRLDRRNSIHSRRSSASNVESPMNKDADVNNPNVATSLPTSKSTGKQQQSKHTLQQRLANQASVSMIATTYDWTSPPNNRSYTGIVPENTSPRKNSSPSRPAQKPHGRERPNISPMAKNHLPPPLYPALVHADILNTSVVNGNVVANTNSTEARKMGYAAKPASPTVTTYNKKLLLDLA